jgi:hypothetical protein
MFCVVSGITHAEASKALATETATYIYRSEMVSNFYLICLLHKCWLYIWNILEEWSSISFSIH